MSKGPISTFLQTNFKHFNAAALIEAAQAYEKKLLEGHSMLVSLAGAMSTAELGISLAEMIRADKVHAISCTGANLEEDVFNLVAHNHYKRIPNYRDLSPFDEQELLNNHYNRVTDTCIPEMEAMRVIEEHLVRRWVSAASNGTRKFPHEYFYDLLLSGDISSSYQINPKHSWLLAAAEKNLPIVVPGWEDSTCGNFFASHCIEGRTNSQVVRSGIEYMIDLAAWYQKESVTGIGFFQIGGGIAGDFPICVVPMIEQDLGISAPLWSYFCQISDSTTSYGSYSGAIPNEKITWGKLGVDTPKFVIESDATIVAPLIFAYLLDK
jgi:deoxyhypusine synthase